MTTARLLPSHPRARLSRPSLAAAVAVVLAGSCLPASASTWVGKTAPANWSTALNWDTNLAPLDFDSLTFGASGTAGTTLNNDLPADRIINGISFLAGAPAYTISGNRINLVADLVNGSTSTQTLQIPLVLDSQRTFTTTFGGGNITLSGVISGVGGVTHTSTGTGVPGVLTLAGTANTYTELTEFNGGIINVASVSDYGVASSIGARTAAQETATGSGIGLHFRGGTLQYTGTTAQSTNREIRILNGNGAFIDASGATPEATLSFTHTGANINLFDTPGIRTLTLTGTNTGQNRFLIQLTDQSTNQTTLRKAGTGTWYIANTDNTYTGETIFAGGILNVASLSDYGAPSSIGPRSLAQENTTVTGVSLHFQGGTLQYTGSTPQSTNRNIRILNGNGATIDASGSTPDATLSFTKTGANINLFDTGGARTLTLTGTNTGNNSFSIQLTNQSTNTTGLTKTGAGKWILNGPDTNTATGVTTVSGGTLVLAKTNAVAASGNVTIGSGTGPAVLQIGGTGGNQIADSSIVSFGGFAPDTGILRLAGLNETVGGIASTGGAGIIENEAGAAGTATLTVNLTGTQNYSGTLRNGDGTGIDGSLALTKIGAGTLILSGTTTHSGPTIVSAGTLTIDGTLGSATTVTLSNATLNGAGTVQSTVNVNSGGVVSSFGSFTGPVILNNGGVLAGTSTLTTVTANSGARISPAGGTIPGTLNIGALTLSSGALLDYELDAVSDLVNITTAGGLALNGGAFNLFGLGGTTPLTTNGTYTLVDYNGSFTGSLANLSIANSQVGKFYTLTDDTATTRIVLTVSDTTITEWNAGAADGKWSTAGNWTAGVPNAAGAVAKFGSLVGTASSVAVNGPKTVGGILFDNTASYTITGTASDTITLNNGVAAATITVATGDHTISAPLILATSANASTAAGRTLTITGNITGNKPFIASGSGTTILKGTNTYGATTVTGGVLQVSDGTTNGTLGTGDVTVEPGATLVFNRSDDITIPNNISGPGAQVTKLGAGTMTLSGTNTFATTGGSGFNLNAGTVKLANANALASGVVLGFNGGALDLNGNNVVSSFLTGGGGTITDTSGAAGTTSFTVNQSGTTTFGGNINNGATRTVSLTKSGSGVLTLTGNNTFKGPLTITEGTVIAAGTGGSKPINTNVVLGNGSAQVMLTTGSLDQQFAADTVLKFDNGSRNTKFQLRGSTQTLAGIDAAADSSVTLAIIQNDEIGTPGYTAPPGPGTLTLNTTTDHSFTGLIRNQVGGGLNLVKEGPATQEIRNALVQANFINSLTVNAGTLLLNYISNGGNTNTFLSGATTAAPVSIVVNSGGTLAFDGNVVIPGPTTTNIGAVISGNGTIVRRGSGSAKIASPNTFAGTWIIDAGTLEIGNNQALGDPNSVVKINGGTIRAADATREIPNPIEVNGDFTLGRQTNLNGNITLKKDVTLIANNPDGAFNTTSALGPVSGPFRLTVQQGTFAIGTGAIIINGQNTNSGGTTIASARVNVSPVGALANADLTVNGGELNLNNGAQTVTSLGGTGGTMNLGLDHTLTVQQSINTTFAGVLGGTGALVKSGAGSLTLSANSGGYSGLVSVTEGALVVTGSIGASVTVSGSTAVFSGNGGTGFITVESGGTLNPGTTNTGLLSSLGDVTLRTGTRLQLQLDAPVPGTGYDQVALFGTATLEQPTLSLSGSYLANGAGGDLFFVMLNNGFSPINGTFAGLPEGSSITASNGQKFTLTYLANSDTLSFTGGNDVALMSVPEPSAMIALLGGSSLLLGMRRQRRPLP